MISFASDKAEFFSRSKQFKELAVQAAWMEK
jgi:hypothetical protein